MKPFTAFVWMLGGPIIWAAHFFSIYIAETLVCASIDPSTEIMRGVAFLLTLMAFALIAAVIFSKGDALADIGRFTETRNRDFLPVATMLLAFLSALAVLWTAIAAFWMPVCTFAPG